MKIEMLFPKRLLIVLLLIFFYSLAVGGDVFGQEFISEKKFRCSDSEIVVSGGYSEVRLFRNESERIEIGQNVEVVWFCDRTRREFVCDGSEIANMLQIEWDRSGQVTFQCLRF